MGLLRLCTGHSVLAFISGLRRQRQFSILSNWFRPQNWCRIRLIRLLAFAVVLAALLTLGTTPALAELNDDHFDGNIYALYGGNGSLVPPRSTLAYALKRNKPTLIVFYLDDSRDCKQYATVVSRIQAYYGRAAELLPINVDSFHPEDIDDPTQSGYYYEGFVPQLVLFNQSGDIVLNEKGQVPFEQVDDVFRDVFDLLPRSESLELKRRSVNEVNTELVQ